MLTETEARELTYYVALEWTEEDRAVLGPLVDAALVWSEDDALAEPVIDTLWRDGLREDLERALARAAERHAFVARLRPPQKPTLPPTHTAASSRVRSLSREPSSSRTATCILSTVCSASRRGSPHLPKANARRPCFASRASLDGSQRSLSASFAPQSRPPRLILLAAMWPLCWRQMSGVAWFARGSRTSRNSGPVLFRHSPPSSALRCGGRSRRSPTTGCGARRSSA